MSVIIIYSVYQKSFWQCIYSTYMLLICKHLGIMEDVWKIHSSLQGKKE